MITNSSTGEASGDMGTIINLKELSMSSFLKLCVFQILNSQGDYQKYTFSVSNLEVMLLDDIELADSKLIRDGKENESYSYLINKKSDELKGKNKLGDDPTKDAWQLAQYKFQQLIRIVKRDIPIERVGVL